MVLNIRLDPNSPNMVRIDGYFYNFNHQTDVMVQKADDGTIAFSYPLDTPISRPITSLEHDGESFWTMENIDGTPDNGFVIKRWLIQNFVMVLQNTFTFASDGNDTFESKAFTVEHYEGTLTSGAVENTSSTTVSFDPTIFALLTPGTKLFLGPSTKSGFVGELESVTVNSTGGGNTITFSSPLNNGFLSGDKVVFSKNLWVFNENFNTTLGVGALYKLNSLNGNILLRQSGGAFKDINSTTFHELSSFTGSLASFNKPYLTFIRTSNLLFLNTNDANLTVELSAVQNNVNAATTTVFDVFDLGIEGDTIFRLQDQFNINGTETSTVGSSFNYQLATFKPFPTAIAITATPAILAADSISTSIVVATVTDQYALAFVTSPASTITFTTAGGGTGSGVSPTGAISLDSSGQATVTYTAGDAAGLVTISATVTIN